MKQNHNIYFHRTSLQGFGCNDVVYQSEKPCNRLLHKRLLKPYIAVEEKVRTLLNAEIQSEITSDFLLTRSAILRVLYSRSKIGIFREV